MMSHRGNYLDLDPTYRDGFGRPMLRMTFDFSDNERKMSAYIVGKAAAIGRAMDGATGVKAAPRTGSWSVVPYQTTHNTGGTISGDNPRNSVINKYLQSWEVPNVFVMGSGAYPQNAGYNPTATLAALAYHSAAAIKDQYLKSPGPLVRG
jgi:gluconate 2-dehydrogenase alpha chain